jgi:tRNA (uracil-5-)-methyltransferase TRM9
MDIKIIKLLNQVNNDFYKAVHADFDDSRGYFWKGWDKLVEYLPDNRPLKVLDVGCGNGRFYEFLVSKDVEVDYVGIDNSKELLDVARKKYPEAKFENVDIIEDVEELEGYTDFDLIVSFGVFHHIPSLELRKKMIQKLSFRLSDIGILAISFWQFTKSENLMKRVSEWSDIGITAKDVEEGDYLLDWQRGEKGLRYCHMVGEEEILALADNSSGEIINSYSADGKSKDLNLYVIFKKIISPTNKWKTHQQQ